MSMTKAAKAAVQTVGEDEARQMLALCVLKMLPEKWVEEMTEHVQEATRKAVIKKKGKNGSVLMASLTVSESEILTALYADGKGKGWKPLNMIAALTEEIEKECGK